jgi:chromosome segregation ATPase
MLPNAKNLYRSVSKVNNPNPVIQTDIAELLGEIRQELKGVNERLSKLEVGQAEITGQIKAVDEKLSGQIKAVDEKLSGQIKAVDERLSGQIKSVDERLSGQIKSVDERLSGQIKSVDERLSGQIKSVDERLSGQVKALDTKVDQLDKRIGNSELTNRGVLIGLIVIILGGAAKLFGLVDNA